MGPLLLLAALSVAAGSSPLMYVVLSLSAVLVGLVAGLALRRVLDGWLQ